MALGALTIFALSLCTLTPLPNLIAGHWAIPSYTSTAGAIVVLGGGLMDDGVLSDGSMQRLMHGILLYKSASAPLLVLLGPASGDPPHVEAEVRAELARRVGVPSEAILTISEAYTTRLEAILSADLLKSRQVNKVILVTDSLHMRRAKLSFQKAGFDVQPASWDHYADTAVSPTERIWLMSRIAQDTLALLYYRLAGYI
jgi:uncharacterized SAM-binding protein YcdF (DUF218 family)